MSINHALRQRSWPADELGTALRQNTEIAPSDWRSYSNRGYSKMKSGDYQGAISDFDQASEFVSDRGWLYTYRGQCKMHIGDYVGAISDFERAVQIDPNDTYAQENADLARSRASE